MLLLLKLLLNILIMFVANDSNNIDYEDIYDNIDDYEYPYNHINRGVEI